jgi:nicotinamidase-related amidase
MRPILHAALVPIDVQCGFDLAPWTAPNNPDMEANGRRLLAAWRKFAWPILHVRHDSISPTSPLQPGLAGNRFREGFAPQRNEPVVSKSVNCAFIGTDLELRLRRLRIDTLVLFGISTDMCVSTTARVSSNLGFRTLVVADACRCFALVDGEGRTIAAKRVHEVHLATLQAEFAEVATTDSILHALSVAAPPHHSPREKESA